jgi:hypothetical protein
MANTPPTPDVDAEPTRESWFQRPLSGWWCAFGWLVATVLLVFWIQRLGGPAGGDAFESDFSSWGIQHGQWVCMYPPSAHLSFNYAAPVYPLLSGGLEFITRIGHGTPFPSNVALGHNCTQGLSSMANWGLKSNAVTPTLRVGYVGWILLLAGVVAVLRVSGRGLRGWEPATVVLVACLPPVWMCIEEYFHPQDLVAMGFALAAVACAVRSKWILAGILVALAVLTQQYALLVALPLLVVAPMRQRIPFVAAAAVTALAVIAPIMAFTAGKAARFIFLGTGDASGQGGTVVWEFHLHGALLVLISRVLPLALSLLLAVLVVRRVGTAALEPIVLVPLVALSLSLRLVFEQNVFGYYYMALAVSLLLVEVVRGHIRESFFAWIALILLAEGEGTISLIIWRQSWGQDARHWIPVIIMAAALLLIIRRVLLRRVDWNVAIWAGVVIAALIVWPVSTNPLRHQPVTWLWEVVLVTFGVILAAGPLLQSARSRPEPSNPAQVAESEPFGAVQPLGATKEITPA